MSMQREHKKIKYTLMQKMLITLLILGVVMGTLLATFAYKYTKRQTWESFSSLTTSCSVDVAKMMHGAPFKKFLEGEQKELYNAYLTSIKDMANSFGLEYLYVYIPDIKNNRLIAIMGVEGKTGNIVKDFDLGQSPQNLNLNDDVMGMFYSNGSRLIIEVDNQYGHVISGYSTITDENSVPVAIVGADIDFGSVQHKLLTEFSIVFVLLTFALILIFLLIMVYVKRYFINPVTKISKVMNEFVEDGNVDSSLLDLNTNDEFNLIANLYNIMAAEKKNYNRELAIAKSIQLSSLPSVFPPFPDHKEFDIYANMIPAKEVGGDFYDFFFINRDKFAFLVADVSGKGVPAALFMMEVKTLLKNTLLTGLSPEKAMNKINQKICQDNSKGMFVTILLAVVNITSGEITFVNAGHNPPLFRRAEGNFEYCDMVPNVVVGAVDNFRYKKYDDKLYNGDELYFYTDGVTEAMSEDFRLYGENKLKEVLNRNKNINQKDLITLIKQDIKDFVQGAEQSDDITSLIFKYTNDLSDGLETKKYVTTLLLPASIERFKTIVNWVKDLCEKVHMKQEYRVKLNLAIEEIFVNISTYAYPPKDGDVEILFKLLPGNEVEVRFTDSGTPYNPMKKSEPDVNASVDDRVAGGLGIFLVRNSIDYMNYEYIDNKNVLTIRLKYEVE